MLTLLGIGVLVLGFGLRLNPLLAVTAAAVVTALAAGMSPLTAVAAFGKAFNENRYVSVIWIILPVIGLLEGHGLQVRARRLVARLTGATAGRLLIAYLLIRQIAAALGLNALGGHAQMVRPLVAPMAESAAEQSHPGLGAPEKALIRAHAAAAENVGAFFGEDIFIAFGSILLIRSTLHANGLDVSPLQLSAWAGPTAAVAFAVHAVRLARLDRRIAAAADEGPHA
jgi:uncharacterized membrane protein